MQVAMAREEEPSEESAEEGQFDDEQDDDKQLGGGPYATLHLEGPQVCLGSAGHPDACVPCTFYCFTRRGCNRGLECRFCHLTHQSKLQQRREAWKKQQREKRKSIRERVAAEALTRRHTPGGKGAVADADGSALMVGGGATHPHAAAAQAVKSFSAYPMPPKAVSPWPSDGPVARTGDALGNLGPAVFSYSPGRAILTIGQEAEFRPQLQAAPTQFRLTASLPQGLILDPVSGVISGVPVAPLPQITVVVEADLLGGPMVRAALELEVVDFTRGGFVIGHMSEFEPGKFMLILYVPQESENNGCEKACPLAGTLERYPPMLDNGAEDNGQLAMRKHGVAMEKNLLYSGGTGASQPRGGAAQITGGDRQAGRTANSGAGRHTAGKAPGQFAMQPEWW